MSRRRYLSTDISLDVRVNRLAAAGGDFAVMLYTWMIPHAADDASLPSDPEELMFMVIPGRRDKTPDDVQDALDAMCAQGLVIIENGRLGFPAEAFYRYQTYIQEGKRRGANQRESAQDSEDSANQRRSAQNTTSPSPSVRDTPPTPSEGEPADEPPRVAKVRGSRIPADFAMTPALYAYAADKGVTAAEAESVTEGFVLYWQSASGRTAIKMDWNKAWMNRVLDLLAAGKIGPARQNGKAYSGHPTQADLNQPRKNPDGTPKWIG